MIIELQIEYEILAVLVSAIGNFARAQFVRFDHLARFRGPSEETRTRFRLEISKA